MSLSHATVSAGTGRGRGEEHSPLTAWRYVVGSTPEAGWQGGGAEGSGDGGAGIKNLCGKCKKWGFPGTGRPSLDGFQFKGKLWAMSPLRGCWGLGSVTLQG